MYQPKTLYDICKHRVQVVYKNNWDETKILPQSVQHELLLSWLRCEETVPESDEDIEKILENMKDGWEAMKPISPLMFLYLMRLPDEIPPFANYRNHVIWDYYEWHKGGEMEKLCSPCMSSKSQFYKPWSANLWLENDWIFKHVEDHDVYRDYELLEKLIWDESNWCSNCLIEPLWEHILDDDDCLEDYDYHMRKRRRWDTSSSEDEEDDISYRRLTNVVGHRMSPTLYSTYKENKWFY